MDLTGEQIIEGMKYIGSALGGGAVLKAIEFVALRKKRNAEIDSTISKTAVEFIDRQTQEISTLKRETQECHDKHDALRIKCTDLEIAVRGVYGYMCDHIRECQPERAKDLPSLESFMKPH